MVIRFTLCHHMTSNVISYAGPNYNFLIKWMDEFFSGLFITDLRKIS